MRRLTLVFALVSMLANGARAENVLVLDWGSQRHIGRRAVCYALPDWQLTLTEADAWFNDALLNGPAGGGTWDLIVCDNPTRRLSDSIPALVQAIDGGTRVILDYWALTDEPALLAAMDLTLAVDLHEARAISAWQASDPLWNTPLPVSGIDADPEAASWFTVGQRCEPTAAAIAVGGYGAVPMVGEAAIVRSLDGRRLAFLHNWDQLEPNAALAVAINAVAGVAGVSPTCFGIEPSLTAIEDCASGAVTLEFDAWDPATLALEVRRGTQSLATLDPTATSYVDLPDAGIHEYSIVAHCAAGTGCAVSVEIATEGGSPPPKYVVWAGESGDGIDSAAAWLSALDAVDPGASVESIADPGDLICLDPSMIVIALLGTFPAQHSLTTADGDWLRDHVESGGSLYIEGADIWGFDVSTAFSAVDGVDDSSAEDGDDSFVAMQPIASPELDLTMLFTTVPYIQAAVSTNDYNDRLQPASAMHGFVDDALGGQADPVWSAAGGAYHTAIAYRPLASMVLPQPGRVLCQSWEFGGFGGSPFVLATEYLRFLGALPPSSGEPYAIRGDANDDASVEVSDAIELSNQLLGLSTPTCWDASDVNADGQTDIADVVDLLAALFVAGSPSPAPPYPECGAMAVSMGCDGVMSCP